MPENKIAVSYRLSPEGIDLVRALAEHYAVSQAGVIEMGVRLLAEKIGFQRQPASASPRKGRRP